MTWPRIRQTRIAGSGPGVSLHLTLARCGSSLSPPANKDANVGFLKRRARPGDGRRLAYDYITAIGSPDEKGVNRGRRAVPKGNYGSEAGCYERQEKARCWLARCRNIGLLASPDDEFIFSLILLITKPMPILPLYFLAVHVKIGGCASPRLNDSPL